MIYRRIEDSFLILLSINRKICLNINKMHNKALY